MWVLKIAPTAEELLPMWLVYKRLPEFYQSGMLAGLGVSN
jgi:hypothetical protein